MKTKIIIKRYADAFINYAKPLIGLGIILSELKTLRAIIRENPAFLDFLENRGIAYSEKCKFIDKVLEGVLSNQIRQFIKLLLDKERIEFIDEIIDYIRVVYSHVDTTEAVLKTTFPLELELIKDIKDKLEHKLNKKLNLYIDMDSDLLGGVQVKVGNIVIDGSVRKRIEDLREKLMNLPMGVMYGYKARRDNVDN